MNNCLPLGDFRASSLRWVKPNKTVSGQIKKELDALSTLSNLSSKSSFFNNYEFIFYEVDPSKMCRINSLDSSIFKPIDKLDLKVMLKFVLDYEKGVGLTPDSTSISLYQPQKDENSYRVIVGNTNNSYILNNRVDELTLLEENTTDSSFVLRYLSRGSFETLKLEFVENTLNERLDYNNSNIRVNVLLKKKQSIWYREK